MASITRWQPDSAGNAFATIQVAHRALRGLCAELALFDQLRERARDVGPGCGGGLRPGIVKQHLDAGLGGDLGDAAAHDAGADHAKRQIGAERIKRSVEGHGHFRERGDFNRDAGAPQCGRIMFDAGGAFGQAWHSFDSRQERRAMIQSVRWALAALVLAITGFASGQEFPVRPITMIVPWPAGGSTDTHMRRFSEISSRYLGQQIVVENRPGGGGTLGPGTMAQTARPDGYTLSQLPMGAFRVLLSLLLSGLRIALQAGMLITY